VDQEINYTLSIEEFVNFLKGRTVIGEVEGFETPDGPGWGVELGTGTKVLFVSKWGADGDELPSISGNAPQIAQKPTIYVYEKPQHEHDCNACKFLGTYHYFDRMICEYKIIDLYMCDTKDIESKHPNDNTCPTFLGRLGYGEGNYFYGHSFNFAEQDPVLKEAIARAIARELFNKEDYPELIPPKQAYFSISASGGVLSFGDMGAVGKYTTVEEAVEDVADEDGYEPEFDEDGQIIN